MKIEAPMLVVVGSLFFGCESSGRDVVAVESNDLGIAQLEIRRERDAGERLLTLRGVNRDGMVIATAVLRTGMVLYGADMPAALHPGTELTITVGETLASFVSPDRAAHAITEPLSPAAATFVGLRAVAAEIDREAGIQFAPAKSGGAELAYTSQTCDGSRFPTNKGGSSQCCQDTTNTYHVNATNAVANRFTYAPAFPVTPTCRKSDGTTGCTTNCLYGPCGSAIGQVAGTNGHVFHPTSNPNVCGWDTGGPGGLGVDYSPEHYASQSLWSGVTASCTCTGCNLDGTAVCPATYTYVKASNTTAEDYFARSIAISRDGNTVAVGAYWEDSGATGINGNPADNSKLDSGAVYVYTRSGGVWSQQAYVKASNTDAGDEFGWSVALSTDGNTMAVGANAEASVSTGINGNQNDNSESYAGAVYIYTRSGSVWTQQAYVKASRVQWRHDGFGYSVALSSNGNTLSVGTTGEPSGSTGINGDQDNFNASGSGAVYVFTRSGTTWSQQAYIKASNTDANDNFGGTVALASDGNTLAVGAHNEDSNALGINGTQTNNSATDSGAVYVFTRSGTTWSQQAYVKASNTGAGDTFSGGDFNSISLSANGNTMAVGANQEDSNATGIGGNQGDNSATDGGAVYVFTRTGTAWTQQAYIKASNNYTGGSGGALFGTATALSDDGNMLLASGPREDGASSGINGNQNDFTAWVAGAVYRFKRFGTTWVQDRYIKANVVGPGDHFGMTLGMTSDGLRLLIGAKAEDSNATGINGNQNNESFYNAGAAYIID